MDVSAIVRLMPELSPVLQVRLITALSNRSDVDVVKATMAQVQSDNESVQIAALKSLAKSGNVEAVPLLAETAASNKGKTREIARLSLYRINGNGVDKAIINNAVSASPLLKTEYILAIGERQMMSGIPFLFDVLDDEDSNLRMAALKALRDLADPQYIDQALANLVSPKSEKERNDLERVVVSMAAKIPDGEPKANKIVEKYNSSKDNKTKVSLLEVLGKIGDSASLPPIREALNNPKTEIRTAAIRSLSSWPTAEPVADLLKIAKNSKDEKSKILALRGYVKLIGLETEKSREEILEQYQTAMELATNVEEKRAVLSGLSTVISHDALDFVSKYIDNKDLQMEAASTTILIAEELDNDSIKEDKVLIKKALSIIKDEDLLRDGGRIINRLEMLEDFITVWQVSGPYNLEEADVFAFAFPPEKNEEVVWKKVAENSDKENYWHVDLQKILRGDGPVAYLRNNVISDKNQDVQLQVGSNDGVRVWLNGKLVHSNASGRSIYPGEDKINVNLKKGVNNLLIKVVNLGGAWGACARFRTTDGSHLEGLKFELPQ
jgi:HEAT repeat protein